MNSFNKVNTCPKGIKIIASIIAASFGYSIPLLSQGHFDIVPPEPRRGEKYIECLAEKYDEDGWFSLGKFTSLDNPGNNNGGSSSNAELESDQVRFSAAANFQEGLLYFGGIYDYEHRVGTQIVARQKEITVYLLIGQKEYSLSCSIIE